MLFDYWSTGNGLVRHFVAEHVTGPKGDFSFDVRKGIYSLEVIPNRDTRFARQALDTVKVSANTTVTINLKHGAVYSGRVRNESGGTVGPCELVFFGIEPDPVRATEPVEADGRFSVTLPRGKYYVGCRYVAGTAAGSKHQPFLYPTLHVIDLYDDERDDFVIPDMVLFKGVITNSDGHPVSGVRATISTSSIHHEHETEITAVAYSNKIGQFQCNVAPGTYDVKLEPGPDSHLSERTVSAILVDQARTRTYSLASGYRLYGQVLFEGEPVQNALVTISGGKIDSSCVTDEDGVYSFSLSGGSYALNVVAQPDSLASMPFRLLAPYSATINLAEDTHKDVSLERGTAVAGRIVDGSGNVRPGLELAVYSETMEESDRPITFGITGDDGSFEFRLTPGSYWVVLNNQRSTAQKLEVAADDLQQELIWGSGCIVRFEVMSEAEEPIAGCRIVGEPYGATLSPAEEEQFTTVTADDGTCRLMIPSGIYTFKLEPPEAGSFQPKQIRQLSINGDLKRRVKLQLKTVPAGNIE